MSTSVLIVILLFFISRDLRSKNMLITHLFSFHTAFLIAWILPFSQILFDWYTWCELERHWILLSFSNINIHKILEGHQNGVFFGFPG